MDKRERREEFPTDQQQYHPCNSLLNPFLHTVPGWLLEHHSASQSHSCVEWNQAR